MSCASPAGDLGGILLIENDPAIVRAICRVLPGLDVATTWEDGRTKSQRAHIGVIADIGLDPWPPRLGDRTGIDHAEVAHARFGSRIMLLSGHYTPEWRARATAMGAQYVLKPFRCWMLLAFQDHCYASSALHVDDDLRVAMDENVSRYAWSAAMASIVLLVCQRYDCKSIAVMRGVAEKTIACQIGKILQTTGDDHIWQTAMRVQEDARRMCAPRKSSSDSGVRLISSPRTLRS